jgi:hypothetical protein
LPDYNTASIFMSNEQSSSSPNISLRTQLDHWRDGHTVLRSFLPPKLIQQLRSEIVPYATSNALSAWHQKVEVQLNNSAYTYQRDNAISIANNLRTIYECISHHLRMHILPRRNFGN